MLISELRNLLGKYKEDDLRYIIIELYKYMPKRLKDENDIDNLLQDINIKKIEKLKGPPEFVDLKQEINQFIGYAYNNYYFSPNNIVRKNERPKWRFKVKGYIKELQSIPFEDTNGNDATDLLIKLFEMLCYGCAYYIFRTENPFASVGIEQTALLDIVISRKLAGEINSDSIKSAAALVINSQVDRETLPSFLILTLMKNLKTSDSKEIAIEQCIILKSEIENLNKELPKKSWLSDNSLYERKEKINNLVETIFRLNIALCEYEEAIKYYNNNHIENNSEVSLYILLHLLFVYGLKEYWLNEYNESLKKGIKPRESLKKVYDYINKNGELPEYFD